METLTKWTPNRGPIAPVWPSLDALRRARSLSISELAKWAGVDRATAQRALRGASLTDRSRRALASALRVDPDTIQWASTPTAEANETPRTKTTTQPEVRSPAS